MRVNFVGIPQGQRAIVSNIDSCYYVISLYSYNHPMALFKRI